MVRVASVSIVMCKCFIYSYFGYFLMFIKSAYMSNDAYISLQVIYIWMKCYAKQRCCNL